MESKTVLGGNLTRLRKEKGYTRNNMAEFLGTNMYTYRGWEYGDYEPNIENLKKLSEIFNISIDELVGNDNRS